MALTGRTRDPTIDAGALSRGPGRPGDAGGAKDEGTEMVVSVAFVFDVESGEGAEEEP